VIRRPGSAEFESLGSSTPDFGVAVEDSVWMLAEIG
jgi:hypothetical protein